MEREGGVEEGEGGRERGEGKEGGREGKEGGKGGRGGRGQKVRERERDDKRGKPLTSRRERVKKASQLRGDERQERGKPPE